MVWSSDIFVLENEKSDLLSQVAFPDQSGSGNLIRTDDIPGMNRLLYQLSYAAILVSWFRSTETQQKVL